MRVIPRLHYHHCIVNDNMATKIRNQLDSSPFEAFTSNMRIKVELAQFFTYPDIVIIDDKPLFEDHLQDILLNPRALVEVFSETTEEYECGEKFGRYKQLPSLQEVVLVAHHRVLLERHVRQPDDSWLRSDFTDLSKTFEFASVPVCIPIAEIYWDVEFSEKPLR
jgi:Uma2 family endonuclease